MEANKKKILVVDDEQDLCEILKFNLETEVGKQRNRRTQIIITPKLDQFMDLIDKAPEDSQK